MRSHSMSPMDFCGQRGQYARQERGRHTDAHNIAELQHSALARWRAGAQYRGETVFTGRAAVASCDVTPGSEVSSRRLRGGELVFTVRPKAPRDLSQSCNAIAVASKQNAMHMAINANTHKRQPASAPTSFFVPCVLLTYFRIPWHAGRASVYGGRCFAHNALFAKKSR